MFENLTNVMAYLLGPEDNSGFLYLETFDLRAITLSTMDLASLTLAIQAKKLPSLKTLRLSDLCLTTDGDREIRNLAHSCLGNYDHRHFELLYIGGYRVSDETKELLERFSQN